MSYLKSKISRRQCLMFAKTVLIGSSVSSLVTTHSVLASSKADKRDFYYQEKPKDGKNCASCKMFSTSADGIGMCAIVDGVVSPNGWCLAFSPRTS